ncbi:MAG: hypothetical protein EBY57_10355 [Actinobacteria bacterium]|nr:hypothetical protein [Actinomycetota bacterium]
MRCSAVNSHLPTIANSAITLISQRAIPKRVNGSKQTSIAPRARLAMNVTASLLWSPARYCE